MLLSPSPSGERQRGGLGELTQIKRPTLSVLAAFPFVRQAEMAEPQHRGILVRCQGDLDRRRTGRDRGMALPTPTHHQPPRRIDLLVLPTRDVLAIDVDAIAPARTRVELGADAH